MTHAVYVGPIEHLKGETALLVVGDQPGRVSAQFDDKSLTLSGGALDTKADAPPPDALGYGWHDFPAEDFLDGKEPIDEEDFNHSPKRYDRSHLRGG